MSKPLLRALLLGAALLALGALALRTDRPPTPRPVDAPLGEFSAMRARRTLRAITRAPHPVGSAEHTRVRDRLLETLRGLGLEPQVQHATAVSPYRDAYAADIHNVLARLPGTASSGAVLVLAHYDSVIGSYGASDDGGGVAAILELVRTLKNRPPLRNDVIVLLSDGEELGLLGAVAFVREHPWFADVAVVVNIEARGSYGGAFMFQTTGPNGRLIQALSQATPYPVANTVMQEVYERLPNGTDLSAFMDSGVAGLDIAYIRGLSQYHTPLDDFDHQSPASLQHQGSYLLGLATNLGDTDLSDLQAPEQTYFNLGPLAFVHYPAAWSLPLAFLAAALVNSLLTYALARGRIRVIPTLLGLSTAAVSVSAAVLLARLGWSWLAAHAAAARWDSYRLLYDSGPYLLAACAAALSLSTAVTWLLRRRVTALESAAAPLAVWSLTGVAVALYLPGATYLFVWPTLATLLAAVVLATRGDRPDNWTIVALALLAAPPILLVIPWVEWLEVAMTLRIVAVCVGLLAFVAALLAAQITTVVRQLGPYVPLGFLLLSLGSGGWGLLSPEYDAAHKRPDHISYVTDLDTGTRRWISFDPEVDDWTRQFLGSSPTRGTLPELGFGTRRLLLAPAEAMAVESPAITVTRSQRIAESRRIEIRIEPAAGTFRTVIETLPGTPAINERILDDAWPLGPLEPSDRPRHVLTYMGSPAAGFALRLTVAGSALVQLRLRTTRPGLPREPPRSRAADTMSRGDTTVVQTTVTIPAGESQ